jgi:hypothetical protein
MEGEGGILYELLTLGEEFGGAGQDRTGALHSGDFGLLGWPLGTAFATRCKNGT